MRPEAVPPSLEGWIAWLILAVIAVSGLLDVLRAFGFLPQKLADILSRNRLAETLQFLRSVGIDVDAVRRRSAAASLESISAPELNKRVIERLAAITLKRDVTVGATVNTPCKAFIDLMGACTDEKVAKLFARDLAAHWRALIEPGGVVANDQIDFVVTPKSGSPLLGAAFAALINKPFLLHNTERKFGSSPEEFRAYFDCAEAPEAKARALIVDDSSTGGGKVLASIRDLRRFGYGASDVLVVFEPQLKVSTGDNAARRLKTDSVSLHSIVKV